MASDVVLATTLSSIEDTAHTDDELRGTSSELDDIFPATWTSQDPVVVTFLLVVCIFGFVANLAMLISLLLKRHGARKTVNIFICNQTILDLVATFVATVQQSLEMSGYLKGKKTGVLRHLVCLLLDSDAVTSSAIYGSVYGLVVITVERYVKIVHPVAHRNHHRRWMTIVGVATPWLIGLVTSSMPSVTTTKFVDGTCKTQVYNTTLSFDRVYAN